MKFDKRRAFVVILDTMWGTAGSAPKWFLISPENHSGRRLYALTNSHYGNVAVVNACPQQVNRSHLHGTPDAQWLEDSLRSLPGHYTRRGVPLLVCGVVAQETLENVNLKWHGPVIFLDHPAARTWTKRKLAAAKRTIAKAIPATWRNPK